MVVVDDGSTDRSCEIAARYPVRLLKLTHQGTGPSRNAAIRSATGDIIVYIDGDMVLDYYFVEHLVAPILDGTATATIHRFEYVANPSNRWSVNWSRYMNLPANVRRVLPGVSDPIMFRGIFRKVFLQTGGFKNIGYYDDRTVLQETGIKALITPGKCYHFNPDSFKDAFLAAQWIGSGDHFRKSRTRMVYNFIKYSPIVSVFRALRKAIKYISLSMIPFCIVYDFGIFIGIAKRFVNPASKWK